jgi:hydroxypyruvate isomerase
MPRFDVNLSIVFTELPVLQRPPAARAAGFRAVELWWPWPVAVPPDREVEALAVAIQDAGVSLVSLNFFAGDPAAGERGLVSWPGRAAEFADSVDVAVGLGARLGCRAYNALYGTRIPGVPAGEQDDAALANLSLAAGAAARAGGVVLVEPVSGVPGYPLKTAGDAVAVLDRVERATGATNLRLLLDLYHLAVNGEDVVKAIDCYGARAGHVQIADAPGRHQPGTGTLDLAGYLRRLDRTGYDGWVGLEYHPTGASADSFGWLREVAVCLQ